MISCEQHDYIEIACIYRYPINLIMKNGTIVECIALDTQLDKQRQECVKVEIEGVDRLVVLDDVASIQARIENPHFHVIYFGKEN